MLEGSRVSKAKRYYPLSSGKQSLEQDRNPGPDGRPSGYPSQPAMEYPACLVKPYVGNTFLGVPISQTWNDLALWEAFLDEHTVKGILELGTWKGGMALFLGHQACKRGIHMETVDCNEGWLECRGDLEALGVAIHLLDVFSPEGAASVRLILRDLPRPCLLFCDNGNKPLEWATFAPCLEAGDFAAVHDWLTEFHPDNCRPELEPVWHDRCEEAQSMTRFFRSPKET